MMYMNKVLDIGGVEILVEVYSNQWIFGDWPRCYFGIYAATWHWTKSIPWLPLYPPCPLCHGTGGWTDVIDPELGGPHEDCGYCNAIGTVNWWQWFKLPLMDRFYYSKVGDWYYDKYLEFFDGPYRDFWHRLHDMADYEVKYPTFED